MNTWLPWMSCISFTLTITLLFLWYSTHRRLLILSAALSMGMLKKATGFELRDSYTVPQPTTSPSFDMAQEIVHIAAQIRTLDVITALSSIILVIFAALLIIGTLRNAIGRRSYLYLEILSQTQCLQIRFARLPNATRHLAVRVPREPLTFRLVNYFVVARLTVAPQTPKIIDTLTYTSSRLHASIFIAPWTAFRLQKLIGAGPYSITPILVHTHQYVYLEQQNQSADSGLAAHL